MISTKFVFANTLFTSHFTFVFLPAKLKDWCEVEHRSVEVPGARQQFRAENSAAYDTLVSQSVYTITEKAPTRAFSWLISAFTFKTLLRHYAKRALTPR